MKQLSVRLSDELHAEATEKAEKELRSLNAVIVRLIERWVAGQASIEPPERSEGQNK
jgi:predicted HicB family RNase H-like nuclease